MLAMEWVTGRSTICACAQFVFFARPGKQLSRCRPKGRTEQWPRPPAVLNPGVCPVVRHWRGDEDVHAGLDIRGANGRYGLD